MRFRVFLLLLVCATGIFVLPHVTHAAIPFWQPIIPDIAYSKDACPLGLGWGAVIVVINNIIQLLLTIMLVGVAPVMIAYAGFLYVVNPVNPKGMSDARGIVKNTVMGLVIALAAWLIVDALMAVLYNPENPGKTWSQLISSGDLPLCLEQAGTKSGAATAPGTVSGGGTPPSTTYGGTCAVPSGGPCATSNMTAFGSAANQASVICQGESGASPHKFGDLTDSGSYVSHGLFQINLTVHKVGGLNCPSAFSGKYTGSNKNILITNTTLYSECVAAAHNPSTNIATAKAIYQSSGNSWKAWSVAKSCNLAVGAPPTMLAEASLAPSAYD